MAEGIPVFPNPKCSESERELSDCINKISECSSAEVTCEKSSSEH